MERWKAPRTVIDLLDRNLRDFPKREAFVSVSYLTGQEVRWTWEDFDNVTDQWANALQKMGVKKGVKVALLLANCAEGYLTYMAILKRGAVLVPVNTRLVGRELEYIFNHSEAEFLIFGDANLQVMGGIRSTLKFLKKFILLAKDESLVPSWALSFRELQDPELRKRARVKIRNDDQADLIYTTGTTGRPKGCILIHANKIACGRMIGMTQGYRRLWHGWDRVQNAFPFFTSTGVSSVYMPWLYYGYTMILEPAFDVEKALQTIEKERSTVYLAAPSMFILIMNHPKFKDYDTSSIRTFGYGGSAMPEEVMRRIYDNWPQVRLYNVYGLTEGGTGGLCCPPADALRKIGSIGIPWGPDQECRIVDEQDRDVPVGEVGEIILRGPNIMKGYYKDPKATREALRGGWLHTGDMGRFDEEGYVYYTDRKKDMIVRGGFNIYPVEVENVLYEHPAVAQCAVVGKSHPILGEDVMAVVVLKPDQKTTTEELTEFCKDKLADFKRPRIIEFRESLPINPMGKVDKKILRASIQS